MNNKGKLDSRDLDNDSQFYYDKMISDINKFVELDHNQIKMIENLDILIKLVKENGYDIGYNDHKNEVEGDLDE